VDERLSRDLLLAGGSGRARAVSLICKPPIQRVFAESVIWCAGGLYCGVRGIHAACRSSSAGGASMVLFGLGHYAAEAGRRKIARVFSEAWLPSAEFRWRFALGGVVASAIRGERPLTASRATE